ncbi:unnamed protein product [Amoebophrya sp. A25]|nr:unnamed protein product [Amoebophrya sp. A25]|eukprot:GSA25T00024398001.1
METAVDTGDAQEMSADAFLGDETAPVEEGVEESTSSSSTRRRRATSGVDSQMEESKARLDELMAREIRPSTPDSLARARAEAQAAETTIILEQLPAVETVPELPAVPEDTVMPVAEEEDALMATVLSGENADSATASNRVRTAREINEDIASRSRTPSDKPRPDSRLSQGSSRRPGSSSAESVRAMKSAFHEARDFGPKEKERQHVMGATILFKDIANIVDKKYVKDQIPHTQIGPVTKVLSNEEQEKLDKKKSILEMRRKALAVHDKKTPQLASISAQFLKAKKVKEVGPNHGRIREAALESQAQLSVLTAALSDEGGSVHMIAQLLEEQRRKNREAEAANDPAVIARAELSKQITALLDVAQSELTCRAIRAMNEALIKDPRDKKSMFRKMLIAKLGSVEGIIKAYDNNGNGDISFTEFEAATKKVLTLAEIDTYVLLTAFNGFSLKKLFNIFDESGDGTIDTVEFIAFRSTDIVQAEWESLSVMQKWKLYCKKTSEWNKENDTNSRQQRKKQKEIERMFARNLAEDRRDVGRKRIRELYKLGETNPFKLAPYIRKGLKGKERNAVVSLTPAEELAFHNSRQKKDDAAYLKENQRKVETAIRHMSLGDRQLGATRESLTQCVEEAEEEQERAKEAEEERQAKEEVKPQEGEKTSARRKKDLPEISLRMEGGRLDRYRVDNRTLLKQGRPDHKTLPHFFEEARVISEKEIATRDLAKEHNMPIVEVDKIQVVFDFYDEDGSGEMESEEFFQLLHVLTAGAEMTDKKRQEYWRQLDSDQSGSVTFDEFLVWYWRFFGAPSMSKMVQSRRMMAAEKAAASTPEPAAAAPVKA